MRINRIGRLAIAIVSISIPVVVISLTSAGDGDPKATREEPGLYYPRRVAIPEDIPSTFEPVDVPGKIESKLVFPVAIYSVSHFRGWQECQKHFGIDGRNLRDCVWKAAILPRFEPFSRRGEEDGYNACRKEIERLLSRHAVADVRRMAAATYRPPELPPPPPPRDVDRAGEGRRWTPGRPPLAP